MESPLLAAARDHDVSEGGDGARGEQGGRAWQTSLGELRGERERPLRCADRGTEDRLLCRSRQADRDHRAARDALDELCRQIDTTETEPPRRTRWTGSSSFATSNERKPCSVKRK